jgi:hypothetical protein
MSCPFCSENHSLIECHSPNISTVYLNMKSEYDEVIETHTDGSAFNEFIRRIQCFPNIRMSLFVIKFRYLRANNSSEWIWTSTYELIRNLWEHFQTRSAIDAAREANQFANDLLQHRTRTLLQAANDLAQFRENNDNEVRLQRIHGRYNRMTGGRLVGGLRHTRNNIRDSDDDILESSSFINGVRIKHKIVIRNSNELPNNDPNDCCPICFDNISSNNAITFNCSHQACNHCVARLFTNITSSRVPLCPLCRQVIHELQCNNPKIEEEIVQQQHECIFICSNQHNKKDL